MWNKRQDEPVRSVVVPPAASPSVAAPSSAAFDRRDPATIGASISVVGDVTGDEDLTILGRVEGKIDLPQHTVAVGQSGRVKADIHAKVVSVAGEVHGNLVAGEQILIRKTATMLGNLTAPRVGLEDGCCFRGSVEMESLPDRGKAVVAAGARALGPVAPAKPPASPVPPAGSPGDAGGAAKPETPLTRP
jgi:cytoskeletal protein CcmA (bactofilin family)